MSMEHILIDNVPSLSEIDTLSDSDWLDIASNPTSDDNDSIYSDRNEMSMPLSRRSSLSMGSSRDGDVEGWEGFASDESEDEGQVDLNAPAPQQLALDSIQGAHFGADLLEDRRERDALDQSMISTLSGSRSSSYPGTVQNSVRDLRLSFPDPLNSPRDDLQRSYDHVSPVKEVESGVEEPDDVVSWGEPEVANLSSAPASPSLKPAVVQPENIIATFTEQGKEKTPRDPTNATFQRPLFIKLKERFNSMQAVTLFALLSLITGALSSVVGAYLMHRASPLPTGIVNCSQNASCNSTTTVAVRTTGSVSVIPDSRNYLPAIYGASSTALSTTVQSHSCSGCSNQASGSKNQPSSTDIIVRQPSSISLTHKLPTDSPRPSTATKVVPPTADSSTTSISIRFVDSLSEIVDATKKALAEVAQSDGHELVDAIDGLVSSLGRQTSKVLEESKSKAKGFREQLQYRNERAKSKAKELRQEYTAHTASLGDKLTSSSPWQEFNKAQQGWRHRVERRSSTAKANAREARKQKRLGRAKAKASHCAQKFLNLF